MLEIQSATSWMYYREEVTTENFWKSIHDLAILSILLGKKKNKRGF